MIKITNKELREYIFDGLDFSKTSEFAEWFKAANEMLENLKERFEAEPIEDDKNLGYIPYALGDIQNLLILMIDKTTKR